MGGRGRCEIDIHQEKAQSGDNFFSHLSCQIWFNNTPHAKIATLKSDQGWMVQEGDYFVFPGGGTSFPEGADGYIEKLGKFIPFGTNSVRTVLDIGCGVVIPCSSTLNLN